MGSTGPAVAILPVDLGPASTFDQNIFPLAYYGASDHLGKSSALITATLEEMEAIKQLGIDLNKNEDFIFSTRVRLEDLKMEKERLRDNRKTLNLFKKFRNYRAAQLLHAASKALYVQTKHTSEKIHREEGHVRVIPATQIRKACGPPPPDAKVYVMVELNEGWNSDAERTINDAIETIATNPFQEDSIILQLGNDEHAITLADTESLLSQDLSGSAADEGNQSFPTSSEPLRSQPTSPQTVTHIHIYNNSIVATNSNVNGPTVNHDS